MTRKHEELTKKLFDFAEDISEKPEVIDQYRRRAETMTDDLQVLDIIGKVFDYAVKLSEYKSSMA